MKTCPQCQTEKEPKEYSKDSSRRDGLQSLCKKCRSDNQKTPAGRVSQSKYAKTAAFRDSQDRYGKTPAGRASKRKSSLKYSKTSAGRQKRRAYRATPERMEADRIYNNSPAGHKVQRKYGLLRYNLTPETFDALLESQQRRCAICGTDKPGGRGTFHVDHDHTCCPGARSCGKCIRGLLCSNCNRGVGHLKDNPVLLRKAADYVEGAALLRETASQIQYKYPMDPIADIPDIVVRALRSSIIAKLYVQMQHAFQEELRLFDESLEPFAWPSKKVIRAATLSAHNLALELVEHFGRGEDVGPTEPPDPEPASAAKAA